MLRAAPFLLLLLTACASTPAPDVPPDVPDPAAVTVKAGDGFRIYVDDGCLTALQTQGLLDELNTARTWLVDYLGPNRLPGVFPPRDTPRPLCKGDAPTPPVPATIDVVVLKSGGRCHADTDGLTVVRHHIGRRDATHELVHFLAGSGWRPIDEGLAVYLTERIWGPAWGVPVKIRARVFRDLNLDEDLFPSDFEDAGSMSRRDYDIAGAFVGWLLEAFPREKFFELYKGPVRNYHPIYDTGETELWARFWRYIDNLDVKNDSAYYRFKNRIGG